MAKPEAPKYRTKNWSAYNAALKSRGSLLVWFDPEMAWFAGQSGKRGRSDTFSDAAIQFCLMVTRVPQLIRQAIDFIDGGSKTLHYKRDICCVAAGFLTPRA